MTNLSQAQETRIYNPFVFNLPTSKLATYFDNNVYIGKAKNIKAERTTEDYSSVSVHFPDGSILNFPKN